MTREELFRRLSNTTKLTARTAHKVAENILLEYIEDDDLIEVWANLRDDWWYA